MICTERRRSVPALCIVLIVGLLAAAALLSSCGQPAESGEAENKEDVQVAETKPVVEIVMQDGGKIDIELDPSAAPITVENFLKLVNEGFYDGLTFHRIIPGFMIQGGDPEGTGMGGAEETIKGEFSSNGVDNTISHGRGVISMARSQSPDSASSQFFITNADATFLDGEYAAFGTVTSGMDVVDRISAVETSGEPNDAPLTPVVIESIKQIN
ncbi:MAG: peptidylprolyl isomerase [Clostridiales Family XIII bacterium]|nr:peptidylprolyl isomerase [Clostridiales Family XIII bacterium]